MSVEVQHIPEITESVVDHTTDPDDDAEILGEAEYNGRTLYQVKKEIVVQTEQYVVYTADAQSSKSYTYYVEQNENGNWEVVKRVMRYGKFNQEKHKTPESTEAVRDALPVEVVN